MYLDRHIRDRHIRPAVTRRDVLVRAALESIALRHLGLAGLCGDGGGSCVARAETELAANDDLGRPAAEEHCRDHEQRLQRARQRIKQIRDRV